MKYVARSIAVIRQLCLSPGVTAILADRAVAASGCSSCFVFLTQPRKKERNPS